MFIIFCFFLPGIFVVAFGIFILKYDHSSSYYEAEVVEILNTWEETHVTRTKRRHDKQTRYYSFVEISYDNGKMTALEISREEQNQRPAQGDSLLIVARPSGEIEEYDFTRYPA